MQREESYEEQIRNCSAQLKDVSYLYIYIYHFIIITPKISNGKLDFEMQLSYEKITIFNI